MNQDRIAGTAQQPGDSAKQEAGRVAGDPGPGREGMGDQAAGTAREATGEAKEAATEPSPPPEEELRRLRAEVDRIEAERAAANAKVARRLRHADAALHERTDAVLGVVRSHPLLSVLGAGLAGFLLARLAGGTTYIYRDD